METIKDESGLQRRKNIVCRVQIQNLIVDVIVDVRQENVSWVMVSIGAPHLSGEEFPQVENSPTLRTTAQ